MHIDETTTTVTPGQIVFAINSPQAEEGCIHYQLYKEAGQPGSYAMIETWATQVNSLPETTMQCKPGLQCRQFNANQNTNAMHGHWAIFLARMTSPDTARQPTWRPSRRQQKATSRQRFRCSSQSEWQGAMGYGKFVIPVVLWLKEHTLNVVFAFSLWLMSKFNRPKIIQNQRIGINIINFRYSKIWIWSMSLCLWLCVICFAAGGFDLESQPLATPTALSARKLTKIETGQNFEPFANWKLFLRLGKLSCFFATLASWQNIDIFGFQLFFATGISDWVKYLVFCKLTK